MRRIALASGLLTLALTACGASGRVVRTGPERPAKPLDCTIQVSLVVAGMLAWRNKMESIV